MTNIQIDAELESLIPPLSEEEEAALEKLILAHGCQQPLVAWKSANGPILIDGHHRHAICRKHDAAFQIVEMEFKNRDEVILWMVRNQLGRRNMTSFQKATLALKLRPSPDRRGLARYVSVESIADLCGLSRSTLQRAIRLEEEADPELKALLGSGAISLAAAFHRIQPNSPPATSPARTAAVPPVRPPTREAVEVTKESLAPRGKTMLNGNLVDDPDDIHKMRQAGRIPAGQVPVMETSEPDDDLEIEEPSEEEWLESLYARPFLSEVVRDRFDRAAKHYRIVAQGVAALRGECRAAIKKVGLQQSHLPTWPYLLWRDLNMEGPETWVPCAAYDKGGCNGTGENVGGMGQCPECRGNGFKVK